MEFVIVFAFADSKGELETYDDGTEIIHTRTIEAETKREALKTLYKEERFLKKPDYLVILGGKEDEDVCDDEQDRDLLVR